MEQSCSFDPHICMEKPLKKAYTLQTVNRINGPKVSFVANKKVANYTFSLNSSVMISKSLTGSTVSST